MNETRFTHISIDKETLSKLLFSNTIIQDPEGNYSLVIPITGWFDTWFELWPRKIKGGGGLLIRSDPNSCKIKMIKFRKSYPQFTPEIIIEATARYIESLRKRDYAFVQTASYYISKDGNSTLYSYCDEVLSDHNEPVNVLEQEFTKNI